MLTLCLFRSSVDQPEAVATWWMDISGVTSQRRWRLLEMNIGCELNDFMQDICPSKNKSWIETSTVQLLLCYARVIVLVLLLNTFAFEHLEFG